MSGFGASNAPLSAAQWLAARRAGAGSAQNAVQHAATFAGVLQHVHAHVHVGAGDAGDAASHGIGVQKAPHLHRWGSKICHE